MRVVFDVDLDKVTPQSLKALYEYLQTRGPGEELSEQLKAVHTQITVRCADHNRAIERADREARARDEQRF